jgi:hypothetical protein
MIEIKKMRLAWDEHLNPLPVLLGLSEFVGALDEEPRLHKLVL